MRTPFNDSTSNPVCARTQSLKGLDHAIGPKLEKGGGGDRVEHLAIKPQQRAWWDWLHECI